MDQLLGHSITYRIAVGPHAGRKVSTMPSCNKPVDAAVGKVAGFSLHAGVAARKDERKKLERLCRYIARPAVSEKRLSHVAVSYDLQERVAAGIGLQVQNHASLVAQQIEGYAGQLRVRAGAHGAISVATGVLYADDIGAQIAEDLRRQRLHDHGGQIQDLDAAQGTGCLFLTVHIVPDVHVESPYGYFVSRSAHTLRAA
jgi:hypothetical protein